MSFPSLDGVKEENNHGGMIEITFRVEGDFNVRKYLLPLLVSHGPVYLAHNSRIPSLLIVPRVESIIAFPIIQTTVFHALSQRKSF